MPPGGSTDSPRFKSPYVWNIQLFAPTTVIGFASCSVMGEVARAPAASTSMRWVLDGRFHHGGDLHRTLAAEQQRLPTGSGRPKYFPASRRVSTSVLARRARQSSLPATTGKRSTSNTLASAQTMFSLERAPSR
jgi:hypothetical protein